LVPSGFRNFSEKTAARRTRYRRITNGTEVFFSQSLLSS
jgi:hypothetical protein